MTGWLAGLKYFTTAKTAKTVLHLGTARMLLVWVIAIVVWCDIHMCHGCCQCCCRLCWVLLPLVQDAALPLWAPLARSQLKRRHHARTCRDGLAVQKATTRSLCCPALTACNWYSAVITVDTVITGAPLPESLGTSERDTL